MTMTDCGRLSELFNIELDDACGPAGFGFVLRDPRPMPFVAFPGARNFFDVPRRVLLEGGWLGKR